MIIDVDFKRKAAFLIHTLVFRLLLSRPRSELIPWLEMFNLNPSKPIIEYEYLPRAVRSTCAHKHHMYIYEVHILPK